VDGDEWTDLRPDRFLQGLSSWYPLDEKLCRPLADLEAVEKFRFLALAWNLIPIIQVTIPAEVRRLLLLLMMIARRNTCI
jgi:hypothetical protein